MDFLPTKGAEYLIAIGYLVTLLLAWRLIAGVPRPRPAPAAGRLSPARAMRGWFQVPAGVHFHQGHTWATPEEDGVFRVGLDDFAQRLVGRPDALDLPREGAVVEPGMPALKLRFDGQAVRVLSPLGGEVVETNPEVLARPGLLCDDPYGRGWLVKVRAPRPAAALSNLMSGGVARAWMDQAAESLSGLMGPKLGPVLQDGGVPVSGFARQLSPRDWARIAETLLLTA
jgi:glycine cleavage system H lipoate-binding protein